MLSFDVDWAPDCAVEAIARRLVEARVRATWFVTHDQPALALLRAHPDLFEIGVHPNFMPGSSHGATVAEVVAHCRGLAPGATAVRTHGLVESSALIIDLIRSGFTHEASLAMPHQAGGRAFRYWLPGGAVTRVPIFWEDDLEMARPEPVFALAPLLGRPGLKVFNLHPVLVHLNAPDTRAYAALKARHGGRLAALGAAELDEFRQPGPGPATMLADLVAHLGGAAGQRVVSELEAAS